jgi:hypothetical protein
MITQEQMTVLLRLFNVKDTGTQFELHCKLCADVEHIDYNDFTENRYEQLLSSYKVAHPNIYFGIINGIKYR